MTFYIGTPYARGAGYFVNNKDASRKQEDDVLTCTHCQCIILLRAWRDDGGFCSRCMAPICAKCADRMLTNGCEPFVAQVERAVKAAGKLDQFRKMAGLAPVIEGSKSAVKLTLY